MAATMSVSALAAPTYSDARQIANVEQGDNVQIIELKTIAGEVEVLESSDSSASVTPHLYSKNRNSMNSFYKREVKSHYENGKLSVTLGVGSYMYQCRSTSINGRVNVKSGMCINNIVIAVPRHFSGKIIHNGEVINAK